MGLVSRSKYCGSNKRSINEPAFVTNVYVTGTWRHRTLWWSFQLLAEKTNAKVRNICFKSYALTARPPQWLLIWRHWMPCIFWWRMWKQTRKPKGHQKLWTKWQLCTLHSSDGRNAAAINLLVKNKSIFIPWYKKTGRVKTTVDFAVLVFTTLARAFVNTFILSVH